MVKIPDALYALALKFKKVELWKKLLDSQLFAVMLDDGSTVYCCVMGRGGQHFCLGVFFEEDFERLYEISDDDYADRSGPFQIFESSICQNCVQISFEEERYLLPDALPALEDWADRTGYTFSGDNPYPCFKRFKKGFIPWKLSSKAELDVCKEALQAALYVARRIDEEKAATGKSDVVMRNLGFAFDIYPGERVPLLIKNGKDSYSWEATTLPDWDGEEFEPLALDLPKTLLEKLQKTQSNGKSIFCDVVMAPTPLGEENGKELSCPYVPLLMLIVENGTSDGFFISHNSHKKELENLQKEFARYLTLEGKPKSVLVREHDGRTRAVLQNICKYLSIPIEGCEDDVPMMGYEDSLYHDMENSGRGEGSGDESVDEMFRLLEMASGEDIDVAIPPYLRDMMVEMAKHGMLGDEDGQRLLDLFKKR